MLAELGQRPAEEVAAVTAFRKDGHGVRVETEVAIRVGRFAVEDRAVDHAELVRDKLAARQRQQ